MEVTRSFKAVSVKAMNYEAIMTRVKTNFRKWSAKSGYSSKL